MLVALIGLVVISILLTKLKTRILLECHIFCKKEKSKVFLSDNLFSGVKGKPKKTPPSDTIIDGNFLSAVFAVVFLMIICVSIYAFYNLFVAILKKFPSKHTEL